jgi:hypothetical protein
MKPNTCAHNQLIDQCLTSRCMMEKPKIIKERHFGSGRHVTVRVPDLTENAVQQGVNAAVIQCCTCMRGSATFAFLIGNGNGHSHKHVK